MTTYNTGNPLGSPDPRDLYDNAENLDEAVNSDAETWQDRLGTTRPTLKRLERDYPNAGFDADRAEAARDEAELAAGSAGDDAFRAESARDAAEQFALAVQQGADIYDSAAAGLAGTVEGDYFFVGAIGDDFLALYRHDPGAAATLIGRSPSVEYLDALVAPIRARNVYPEPTFADDVVPVLRIGNGSLEPITNAYLLGLGAVNGLWISGGTGSTAPYVPVELEAGDIGRYAIMSCYVWMGDGGEITDLTTGHVWIRADNSVYTDGLTTYHEEVAPNVYLRMAWGQIPADAVALGLGSNLLANQSDRLITGITYAISMRPWRREAFAYDDLRPVTSSDAAAVAGTTIDQFVAPVYPNLLPFGDFIGGEPEFRTANMTVLPLTQPAFTDRGFERGVQWGPSNNFARDYLDSDLQGQWVMGAFYVYTDNPANLRDRAFLYQENDGGSLTQLGSREYGYVDLGGDLRLVWDSGIVDQADTTRLLLGHATAPVDDSLYATGFWISTLSSEEDQAAFLRNVLLADKSRKAQDAAAVAGNRSKLVLNGEGAAESYIETERDGYKIRRGFVPFPAVTQLASSVFNFTSDWIEGVQIRNMNDDVAPYRALGTTIGANHGFRRSVLTASGHGKAQADIGSVYSDGTLEHVIVGIPDANSLLFTSRAGNDYTPATTLTHVSGGVNTADVVATAADDGQLYPPMTNHLTRVLVDDIEVVERVAELGYRNRVQIVESYDVLPKSEIVAWFEANGAGGGIIPEGNAAFTVSITYEFDIDGNCTIYTDFLALDSIALQDIMFLQAVRMTTGVDGDVNYYIPKALPVTHAGENYDYANIDRTDTSAWTGRLNFTPARCEPAGILCDRLVQLTDNYGFAMGYLPVQTTEVVERRSQATVKALQISDANAKVYMSAVDKGAITLAAGDYFSTIAYRNVLKRSASRTCSYPVRTRGDNYLYADWHAVGRDRVPVPTDYAGRQFEVVEKSDNVTVLSQSLTNSLVVDVNGSQSYGYLIIRVL